MERVHIATYQFKGGTKTMTKSWKWTQTFEVTVRHNQRRPLQPIDVAVVLNGLPLDVSEANFSVKEATKE